MISYYAFSALHYEVRSFSMAVTETPSVLLTFSVKKSIIMNMRDKV